MPTRPILFAFLATALLALRAGAQGLPDPRFSQIDAVAVGSPLGIAIGGTPAGFDVVVRDVNNAPRPGVLVELRLGAAGLKLYANQAAGTTIDCVTGSIGRVTNAQGAVNFAPRFAGWVDGNTVEVIAGGESLGFVKARSPDYNRDGRVGLADFVTFGEDFYAPPATLRSDFDLTGNVGLGDFMIFAEQFKYANTPQPLCP